MMVVTTSPPLRVPGTAVFMTAQPQGTPPALAHNLRHNKVLHEHVIVLTVTTAQTPTVPPISVSRRTRWGTAFSMCVRSTGSWRTRTFPTLFGVRPRAASRSTWTM